MTDRTEKEAEREDDAELIRRYINYKGYTHRTPQGSRST